MYSTSLIDSCRVAARRPLCGARCRQCLDVIATSPGPPVTQRKVSPSSSRRRLTTSGHRRRIYQHHKSAVEQRQPWLLFDHSQKQRSAYYNEVACQVVLFRSGSNFPASWVHRPTAAFRITRLVNTSLLAGRLPASQRHAIVTSLLKKPGLDAANMANYRPVSNLSFISKVVERKKVLLAPLGPLRGESALSLVFTVVLVTDVLLQLDHVSGTTYLPVWETRKSAALNSENNWKHHVSDGLRRIITFLVIAPCKYSYLLTYLQR